MGSALFWEITQPIVIIPSRRFGTISPYLRLRNQEGSLEDCLDSWPLKMGPVSYSETSARNHHYILRNNTEEHNIKLSLLFNTSTNWGYNIKSICCDGSDICCDGSDIFLK